VLGATKEAYAPDGKKLFAEKVLPTAKKLDAFIAGRKFAAGNNLTFIDFYLFDLEDLIRLFDEATFNSLTNLKAHYNTFAAIPEIKAYREAPRYVERPFFPPERANWS
jgi:glutathione S-transferase